MCDSFGYYIATTMSSETSSAAKLGAEYEDGAAPFFVVEVAVAAAFVGPVGE